MKCRNRYRFTIAAGTLLMFLLMIVAAIHNPVFPQQSKEKERLQRTRQQLEEEIRYTNELLEKTKQSKQTNLNKLQILTKQIRSREALIATINKELREIDLKISVENVQIDRMTRQLEQLKSEYARMIYHAYRTMNGQNKLVFIFSAKDFNQAWHRLKYYQQYAGYRRRQAERIESTQSAINLQRKELEHIKSQKLSLMQSEQTEKQKLDREKSDKAKAVKEFSSKEKQLLSTLRTKQQAAQRLEYAIEKIIADEIKASAERARNEDIKAGRPSSGGTAGKSVMALTPAERQLSSTFAASRGRLPWPTERGFVSESFGEHDHPVLDHVKTKNNGIDILTERGALVRSVFNGRVSKVLSMATLNKVVIIRHGEYLTVYSNLGEVAVREGQEVTAKQQIGRVFAAAGETKSELHFEIWKGKTIQNPEAWLAGR